ncbi:MAG: HEPN domain-containing protein [Firmicutes bacterium]|nr:HEPN domain-containing protein [Bacillota bacterium]
MEYPAPMTDMVCFHMQQAAEKYLKAFLILHGREYPRTHRIENILQICEQVEPIFRELREHGIEELSRYATTIRYGKDEYMPSVEETKRAIQLAQTVKRFVRQRLLQKGFDAEGTIESTETE